MLNDFSISKEMVKKILKDNYDILTSSVEIINRGSANIFLINKNEYILKEFQLKYESQDIIKEVKILEHLKIDGINVPEYIKTKEGKYYFLHEKHIVILEKYIEGETIKRNTANKNLLISSACYLGKIIKSLQTLSFSLPVNKINEIMSVTKINEGIAKIDALLKKVPRNIYPDIYNDLHDKKNILQGFKNLNFDNFSKVTIMNTHGDYGIEQLIIKNHKIKAVLDFASASKMPIIWEIIRSYSYIDSKAKEGIINISNLVKYVCAFSKYVKLNYYDLLYMVNMYSMQIAMSTYGYKEYINDNANKELLNFAVFRTKLLKNMVANEKNITSALINNINYQN